MPFNSSELEYLRSLPAVRDVIGNRITYTESFRRQTAMRYMDGESPVRLFREAGLDPAIIGYKRIERCVERWRDMYRDDIAMDEPRAFSHGSLRKPTRPIAFARLNHYAERGNPEDGIDMRDVLIYQQVRRIAELEQRVAQLESQLGLAAPRDDAPSLAGETDERVQKSRDWRS